MVLKLDDNLHLSLEHFLSTNLYADGWLISGSNFGGTLLDSYPSDDVLKQVVTASDAANLSAADLATRYVLPVVGLDMSTSINRGFEIGSNDDVVTYLIGIAIYAETRRQRDNLGAHIKEYLKQKITLYDYNDWLSPTSIATLIPEAIRDQNIAVIGETSVSTRHAKEIFFNLQVVNSF